MNGGSVWKRRILQQVLIGFLAVSSFRVAAICAQEKKDWVPRQPFSRAGIGFIADEPDLQVVVKFHEGLRVRLREGRWVQIQPGTLHSAVGTVRQELHIESPELRQLNHRVDAMAGSGRFERLFRRSEEAIDSEKGELEARSGVELADLNLYYRFQAAGPAEAATLIQELNASGLVETAYVEPRSEPAYIADDTPPATGDYSPRQGYLDPAPGGIDARYAWNIAGGRGRGVRVVDIEGGWNSNHEDLRDKAANGLLAGSTYRDQGWINHGTAVIGEIVGEANGYGITGIAHEADIRMVAVGGIGVAAAIDAAAAALNSGDVILIELHAPGPRYGYQSRDDQKGYIAEEFWAANYDAIRRATARGIIVVEAAGNGGENLDDGIYSQAFSRSYRDSGAILVGAGAPPSGNSGTDRSRLSFSNYGSRLDVQGWGREVFTAGYGDYQGGDANGWYTARFSGTSSASPIVTGAVACIQGALKASGQSALGPVEMRSLLGRTGSAQQNSASAPANQVIGPRPNLRAALESLGIGGQSQNQDRAQWNYSDVSAGSPHPYSNNYTAGHYYEKSDALYVALHFARLETESNYDFVRIYDREGRLVNEYSGTKESFWVWIPGDYIRVTLVTDGTVTAYGYQIDRVAYYR